MSTNDRDRIPADGRNTRRNSLRLEADYRREIRKAAEERVRRRLASEGDQRPLG